MSIKWDYLIYLTHLCLRAIPEKRTCVRDGGDWMTSKICNICAIFFILSNQKHCHILNALDFIYYSGFYTCMHDCLHVCMFKKHG